MSSKKTTVAQTRSESVRCFYAAFTPIARRFLNRVRMFDSCRGIDG
jgi:hypothetical protein